MNRRSKKRMLLTLAAVTVLVATAFIIVWGASEIPVPDVADATFLSAADAPSVSRDATSGVDLDHSCWRIKLTEPEEVTEPALPSEQVVLGSAVTAPEFRLLGVVIEGEGSQAIIGDAHQQIDIRGRNEPLELEPQGAVVTQINTESVVIAFRGTEHAFGLDE